MYKLNSTSNSAKFFKWMWGKSVTDYKTMCPYFWQYMLTITILPIALPIRLLVGLVLYLNGGNRKYFTKMGNFIKNTINKIPAPSEKTKYYLELIGKWLYISFVTIGFIALNVFIFKHEPKVLLLFYFIIGFVIGMAWVAFYIEERKTETGVLDILEEKPKKQRAKKAFRKLTSPFRMLKNMIVALYKQHCPRIEWTN